MIRRELTADLHNAIGNHPDVFKTYADTSGGPLDFTEMAERPEHFVLLSDGVGFAVIMEWSAPGVWEIHVMALPCARGRRARDAGREMIDWAWEFGADMLWGQTPLNNRPGRWFAKAMGFQEVGRGVHHVTGPVVYTSVRRP